jgi:C-terminal processing protease CtpA/Prc
VRVHVAVQGIKPGDHVLAVNQDDVREVPHSDVVRRVQGSGHVITLTVLSKELPAAIAEPSVS